MAEEWQKGEYCLLLRGKDKVYLFYPLQEKDKTPTDIIQDNKIEVLRVLPY